MTTTNNTAARLACQSPLVKTPYKRNGAANPNWKGGEVTLSCERCEQSFTVKPVRANKARFCSLECANAYQREHPRIPVNKGVKFPSRARWVEKTCEWCNEGYLAAYNKREITKFCSAECHFSWRSARTEGEQNPNWSGGQSRLPYPYNWGAVSRRIRTRDGNSCQSPLCRKTDARLTVHHIDFDKFNVSETNLIALCSSCNSRANFARARWTDYYNALQAVRLAPPLAKFKMAVEQFPEHTFYWAQKFKAKQGGWKLVSTLPVPNVQTAPARRWTPYRPRWSPIFPAA